MNAPENNPDIENVPRMENRDNNDDLRRHMGLLFGALLISSFTLTAYLGLQARRSSMELIAIKPHEIEAIKIMNQDNAAVQSAYSKLADFGRTHPDFDKQILSRYKINSPATNAATVPKK